MLLFAFAFAVMADPVSSVAYAIEAALRALHASSSFQAGPGLFKALARRTHPDGTRTGILPAWLGHTNAHHTPYWAVAVFAVAAGAVTAAAGGRDQELVLFYAASVFVSFFAGLVAMARFSLQDNRPGFLAVNLIGAAAVGFTLVVNLTRGDPVISIGAALAIAAALYRMWVRSGRPRGIRNVAAEAEAELPDEESVSDR